LAYDKRKNAEALFTKDAFSSLVKAKKSNKDLISLIQTYSDALGLPYESWMISKVSNFCV